MKELKLFGKRIKELRKKSGLTQEQLAEKINLFPKQIGNIETGTCFTTINNLKKFAEIFNTRISDLFDFEYLDNREQLENTITQLIKECSEEELKLIYKIIMAVHK